MGTLKVDNIESRTGSAFTIGASGDTITIQSGATLETPGLTLSDNILFDTASKGIYLGVTSATASNLLDDYEEGSFTPTYSTEGGGESITYDGVTSGSYIKIGQLVFVTGYIRTDGWSGGASYVYLDSLPFTINSDFADSGHIGFARANNFTGESPLNGEVIPNTTKMFLKFRSSVTGDHDNTVVSDMDTGTNKNVILFSGTYRTT